MLYVNFVIAIQRQQLRKMLYFSPLNCLQQKVKPVFSSSLIKAGNKPPPTTPGKPKKATTFQEFESITSDAWDVGDDDDELLAMAAQNLNIEVVMETANKVTQRHFN